MEAARTADAEGAQAGWPCESNGGLQANLQPRRGGRDTVKGQVEAKPCNANRRQPFERWRSTTQEIHDLAAAVRSRARYEAALKAVELRFVGHILSVTDAVVRGWGRLSGEIQRAEGRAPPVIDTLIVATAIEHDLCLVTRNVNDVRETGAIVFNPWTDDPDSVLIF